MSNSAVQIKPPKSIGRLVSHGSARVQQLANKILAPHDLTLQQWVVLSALWQQNGLSVGDVCKFTNNALPAMSRLTDRMAKAGWLEKRTDVKDGRAALLYLTEKAEAKRDLATLYLQINDILLAGMSEKEQELLFDLLQRLQDNAARQISSESLC